MKCNARSKKSSEFGTLYQSRLSLSLFLFLSLSHEKNIITYSFISSTNKPTILFMPVNLSLMTKYIHTKLLSNILNKCSIKHYFETITNVFQKLGQIKLKT